MSERARRERPEHAAPPERVLEEIPDRAALERFDHEQPGRRRRVAFRRGGEVAEERVERIDTSRGADIAELHYPDGRYVTVRVGRDVERVEVLDG